MIFLPTHPPWLGGEARAYVFADLHYEKTAKSCKSRKKCFPRLVRPLSITASNPAKEFSHANQVTPLREDGWRLPYSCWLVLPARLDVPTSLRLPPHLRPLPNQQLSDLLRDVINQGADLYNGGDRNGCYRLFQGALLVLRAQLSDPTCESGSIPGWRRPNGKRRRRSGPMPCAVCWTTFEKESSRNESRRLTPARPGQSAAWLLRNASQLALGSIRRRQRGQEGDRRLC